MLCVWMAVLSWQVPPTASCPPCHQTRKAAVLSVALVCIIMKDFCCTFLYKSGWVRLESKMGQNNAEVYPGKWRNVFINAWFKGQEVGFICPFKAHNVCKKHSTNSSLFSKEACHVCLSLFLTEVQVTQLLHKPKKDPKVDSKMHIIPRLPAGGVLLKKAILNVTLKLSSWSDYSTKIYNN